MNFAQLALICFVALLGPLLSLPRGFRVPVVVGELGVGLLLGRTGFQVLSTDDATFDFLAQIGFALIMFVAGSHVPMRDLALRRGAAAGVGRAALVGVAAVPAGYAIAHAFGSDHGALYAVLMASSSAGLVLPALAGARLSSPDLVRMIPQLAVADAACIVALPFAVDPAHVTRAAIGAGVVAVAALAAFVFLNWVQKNGYRRRVHKLSEARSLALELRTSLTLLFALAAVAQWRHVSVMLAGFGLGLATAAAGEPRRLAHQLFALTEGFFGPIFFVSVGAGLDLRALGAHPSSIMLGVALGLGALAVHLLPVVTGQPWPIAGITAAQLGVPVAAAATGSSLHLLQPGEDTAILLGCLITVASTAALAGRVTALAGKAKVRGAKR